jgi:hypothetical protein
VELGVLAGLDPPAAPPQLVDPIAAWQLA